MKKLLSLRELQPIDKLVIITLQENLIFDECLMTSQEVATSIGMSKKKTLDSINKLIELDYINCKIDGAFRSRKSKLTKRLQILLEE